MIQVLISLFLLILPTWFEVYRDRNGDVHPNYDWRLRGITCILAGAASAIILGLITWVTLLCYTVSSICIFTAIFPYWINYVHLKNGITHIKFNSSTNSSVPFGLATKKEVFDHVVNHLSDSAWPDNNSTWRAIGWKGRMAFNIDVLLFGITVFIVCYLNA